MDKNLRHHVVVIGGGFGGLTAVRALANVPVKVTLLDRRNFHLFQPLLYQVATGGLSATNISSPLREILKNQKNAQVILGEVIGFDPRHKMVQLKDFEVHYDTLIISTGASHDYFGHDEWAPLAQGLKSIEDAADIRRRILMAFELAEKQPAAEERKKLLTFVIVGAGPTGVEMAGAIAELARDTFKENFRFINPADARIVLVDAMKTVLPAYPPALCAKAHKELENLGVVVKTGMAVNQVMPDRVILKGETEEETILTRTVVWAAGVRASSLGKRLAESTGAQLDKKGCVLVQPDLTIAGHPDIFVIGDLANFKTPDGKTLPGVAPVAIQEGRYVAKIIKARISNRTRPPFQYRDRGKMATIGRTKAVADLNWIRLSGPLAWLVWLFIHLMGLVSFENRILVFFQWAWNYFSFNRHARLITEEFSK